MRRGSGDMKIPGLRDDGKPFSDTPSVAWDEKVEETMSTANWDRRDYRFADSVLYSESGLIIAACTANDAVTARLPANAIATATQLLGEVRTATFEQQNGAAELSGLTGSQNAALATIQLLSMLARETAKKAFRGQTTRLREQFGVGENPDSLAAITALAIKIHAGCTDADNTAALAAKGWIAADSAAHEAAILALTGADTIQEARKATNKGGTAGLIALNNSLFESVTAMQNACAIQHHSPTADDIVARQTFRIGIFPPVRSAGAPNIPRKLTAKALAAGSLQIYINYNIAARAADYVITSKNRATGELIRTDITTDNKLTITYTGIAPGTELEITMTARNEAGQSKPTRPVTAILP